MRTAVRSLVATLLLGGVALPFSCACGSTTPAPEADGGVAADGGRRDGGFLDLDAGPRADGGDSGAAPDGWATFDGIPNCPLTYPVRADAFPPPIKWVDCPSSLNLPGACKRIALDFADPRLTGSVLLPQGASARADGTLDFTLLLTHPAAFEWRAINENATRTLLRSRSLQCGPGTGHGPADGRYALHGYSDSSRATGVAIVGKIGEPPRVAKSYTTQPSIFAFRQGIGEYKGGLRLLDWETSAETTLVPGSSPAFTDLNQIQEVSPRLYGNAGKPFSVYEYSSGAPKKIVAAGRDVGEIGSFAASPERIFWTNIVPDADRLNHTENARYVQALAADGQLSGVRMKLPSVEKQGYSVSAKMGCNILVRAYLDPRPAGDTLGYSTTGGLEVFNFTTLKHWRLPMPGAIPDNASLFSLQEVHVVTCTEAVVSVSHYDPISPQGQQNFARFDLSKLGPGEPFAMTPDPVP